MQYARRQMHFEQSGWLEILQEKSAKKFEREA